MSRRRRSHAQRRRIDKASLPQRVQQAGGQARAISPAQQLAAQEQGGLSALMYGGAPFAAMPRTDPMVPFGPGVPLLPAPLDPPGASGRPGPRQWEYPITWNLPGFGDRHLPWGTLRAASRVDIVRDCIGVIKKELTGLDWSIAVAEDAVEDLVQSGQAERRTEAKRMLREKLQPDISRAREFWRRPDRQNGLNFQDWFWGVLEEVLVLDALPIYPYESFGGQTLGLRVVDGATIKPLIDHLGLRPAAPQPAFQQILHGFPRGEFTAAADPDGTIDNSFSADELIYVRREVRASSPYGFSPVESALSRINLWLKRMDWMTREWDAGSLPQAMMEVPETSKMTPADLIRWREAINGHLGGDTVERHRIQVSIPGGKLARFTDAADAYKPEYDTFLVKILCSAFGIAPAEIGFIETGGLGGASYHEGQADIQNRKGIAPWVRWFQELFRDINVRYLKLDPAVEFRFQGLKADDEAERDKVIEQRVASGRMTLNEARDEQGMPPYPFHEADQPYVQTGAGVTFLEGQRQIADAQAEAQVAGAQMATQNLQSGKLPSGKDPNTPRAERADGDDARPDDGSTPTADLDENDGEKSDDGASKPNKPAVEKNTRAADELDAFGRWAAKAAKGRAPLRRPFAFGVVDESTGRQLNALAADGLAAEAAVLAKAQAAALRKAGGGASGGAPPPPGGWQGFAALDVLTPRLSPLVSQGARRLIDPAEAAEALHSRFPDGATTDRTALVVEIRQILAEHARPGALAPALTEIYRTGWDAGVLCAERMVAESRPPGLDKAAAGTARRPASTERLMEYWAHGEGAAKIRWGTDHDFDRCLIELGEHVPAGQVKGLCANLHHRALGVWPGQEHGKADDTAGLEKKFDPDQPRHPRGSHEGGRFAKTPGAGVPPLRGVDDVKGYLYPRLSSVKWSDTDRIVGRMYSKNLSYDLNDSLRHDGEATAPGGEFESFRDALDIAISKSTIDRPIVVYRGIPDPEILPSDLDIGDTFTDAGYVSTSANVVTGEEFAEDDGVVIEITLKSGSKALPLNAIDGSVHSHEEEILLPRGNTFTVTGIEERYGRRYIIARVKAE